MLKINNAQISKNNGSKLCNLFIVHRLVLYEKFCIRSTFCIINPYLRIYSQWSSEVSQKITYVAGLSKHRISNMSGSKTKSKLSGSIQGSSGPRILNQVEGTVVNWKTSKYGDYQNEISASREWLGEIKLKVFECWRNIQWDFKIVC